MKIPSKFKTKEFRLLAILLLFILSVFTETPKKQEPAGTKSSYEYGRVVSITDGDTIRVKVDNEEMIIRLIGIDTPETNHPNEPLQCYGPEAKRAIEKLILYKKVRLEKDVSNKDRYDRYLRYVWFNDTFVNEYMVANGYAFSYEYKPDTKYQETLEKAQETAERNGFGLWSIDTCEGDIYK